MANHAQRRRTLLARPLLAAGVGIAAAVYGACGSPAPVGNLIAPPACDAGLCLPDGGQLVSPTQCTCPPDAGGH